jgi:hypothetical protein
MGSHEMNTTPKIANVSEIVASSQTNHLSVDINTQQGQFRV